MKTAGTINGLLLVEIACLVVSCATPVRDPVYQGKPLSSWLTEVDFKPDGPGEKAIRSIGPKALPFLVEILAAHGHSDPSKESVNVYFAEYAFQILGPEAKPAIPQLIELLEIDDTAEATATVLHYIGPAAIPHLIKALKHDNSMIRANAARTLGLFGPQVECAVTPLLNSLKDQDYGVRYEAAKALGEIKAHPEVVVPKLIALMETDDVGGVQSAAVWGLYGYGKNAIAAIPNLLNSAHGYLEDPCLGLLEWIAKDGDYIAVPTIAKGLESENYSARCASLAVLYKLGIHAQSATPALLKALNSPDAYFREVAAKALKEVNPEAATKAGVK